MSNISKIEQLKTLNELKELLEDSSMLTPRQYLNLLKQCQKNFTIRLTMSSITDVATSVLSYMTLVEKIHFLLDSAEPKAKVADIEDGSYALKTIVYEVSDDDAELTRMFKTDDPEDLPS